MNGSKGLDGSKAWAEKFFLVWSFLPLAVFLGVFIGSGLYTSFDDRDSYLVVSVLVTLPCVILPLFFPGEVDRNLPIRERFVFKAIVWNLIFSFIGNYIYTHYFYTLLGAEYTFDTYRFNDVPWPCYIITLTYYCFYHTLSTIALRFVTNATKQYAPLVRNIIYIVVVLLLSYLTAFLETLSIAQFPYYSFPDRAAMYKVGSIFYGLYFVISFPMFHRLDENPLERKRSIGEFALDSFAAGMIVTFLLEAWRLLIGPIFEGGGAHRVESVLPFMNGGY